LLAAPLAGIVAAPVLARSPNSIRAGHQSTAIGSTAPERLSVLCRLVI
jgi:hypothetical protein